MDLRNPIIGRRITLHTLNGGTIEVYDARSTKTLIEMHGIPHLIAAKRLFVLCAEERYAVPATGGSRSCVWWCDEDRISRANTADSLMREGCLAVLCEEVPDEHEEKIMRAARNLCALLRLRKTEWDDGCASALEPKIKDAALELARAADAAVTGLSYGEVTATLPDGTVCVLARNRSGRAARAYTPAEAAKLRPCDLLVMDDEGDVRSVRDFALLPAGDAFIELADGTALLYSSLKNDEKLVCVTMRRNCGF